jgi:hypothetical protein
VGGAEAHDLADRGIETAVGEHVHRALVDRLRHRHRAHQLVRPARLPHRAPAADLADGVRVARGRHPDRPHAGLEVPAHARGIEPAHPPVGDQAGPAADRRDGLGLGPAVERLADPASRSIGAKSKSSVL